MNTPDKEPVNTPATSVAPVAPTVATPAVASDKTSRYIALAALAAAGFAGYTAYNANQQKPAAAITAKSDAAPSSETPVTEKPVKAEKKEMTGEAALAPKPVDFETWNSEENRNSDWRKFHNSGNIADLAYDKEGNHTLRFKTGYELETSRYKGTGKCDEICFDTGTGDNKKATHFEDPNCEKPNTVWMTVASTYNPEAANVRIMRFMGLNGELIETDPTKTVHVPGHVEPGKTCADLARKTNTGTGTVRISDGPTRTEFNNLNVRVGQVEKKVDNVGNTLAGLMDAYNAATNPCEDDPNKPECIAARKAVRHIESDSAAAERKKDNNPD